MTLGALADLGFRAGGELRRGHTEDTGKRPAVFYTYI